jgi:hypothetical protein
VSSDRGQEAADRARDAAERAAGAGQRVAELQRRLQCLRGSGKPSGWTPDAARAAYERSVVLAAESRRSAIVAFNRAADAHRAAAEAARSPGDRDRELEHLELAGADDLSAAALARIGN